MGIATCWKAEEQILVAWIPPKALCLKARSQLEGKKKKDTGPWMQFRVCDSGSSPPVISACHKHLILEASFFLCVWFLLCYPLKFESLHPGRTGQCSATCQQHTQWVLAEGGAQALRALCGVPKALSCAGTEPFGACLWPRRVWCLAALALLISDYQSSSPRLEDLLT